MKIKLLLKTSFLFCLIVGLTAADDEKQVEVQENVDVEFVDIHNDDPLGGTIGSITIDLNGVKNTFQFKDHLEGHKLDALQDLPNLVRQHVERAMKGAKDAAKRDILIVTPDGKEAEEEEQVLGNVDFLKEMPVDIARQVRKAMEVASKSIDDAVVESIDIKTSGPISVGTSVGRVVLVGTDGNVKEIRKLDGKDDRKRLLSTFIWQNQQEPKKQKKEVARKKTIRPRVVSNLESKLDQILNRLEQIEADVTALKEAE